MYCTLGAYKLNLPLVTFYVPSQFFLGYPLQCDSTCRIVPQHASEYTLPHPMSGVQLAKENYSKT